MIDLTGKRVLVVGSGISGIAATELLKKQGIEVVLFDGNKNLDVEALKQKAPVFLDVEIILGELDEAVMNTLDLVVLSPGVPTDLPMVNALREKQIPIWILSHVRLLSCVESVASFLDNLQISLKAHCLQRL